MVVGGVAVAAVVAAVAAVASRVVLSWIISISTRTSCWVLFFSFFVCFLRVSVVGCSVRVVVVVVPVVVVVVVVNLDRGFIMLISVGTAVAVLTRSTVLMCVPVSIMLQSSVMGTKGMGGVWWIGGGRGLDQIGS